MRCWSSFWHLGLWDFCLQTLIRYDYWHGNIKLCTWWWSVSPIWCADQGSRFESGVAHFTGCTSVFPFFSLFVFFFLCVYGLMRVSSYPFHKEQSPSVLGAWSTYGQFLALFRKNNPHLSKDSVTPDRTQLLPVKPQLFMTKSSTCKRWQ